MIRSIASKSSLLVRTNAVHVLEPQMAVKSLKEQTGMMYFGTRKMTSSNGNGDAKAQSAGDAKSSGTGSNDSDVKKAVEEARKDDVKKIEELNGKVNELRSDYLRALADAENTRRIAFEDVKNARAYAVQSFAKNLLDVADNLSLALSYIPKGDSSTPIDSKAIDNLLIGLRMTESEMYKVLSTQGITKFGEVGQKFDPKIHNALYVVEDPTKPPNSIATIIKHGYMIKDRVLRPAQVSCTSASSKDQEKKD